MLTRIVDANGNTIIYENEKGQKTYEKIQQPVRLIIQSIPKASSTRLFPAEDINTKSIL